MRIPELLVPASSLGSIKDGRDLWGGCRVYWRRSFQPESKIKEFFSSKI